MARELAGKRIAFLTANTGVEQDELTRPWDALREAGAETALIAPEPGKVQAVRGDLDRGDTFEADLTVADASARDFDALVLPGGVVNPDRLRTIPEAVGFVASFVHSAKPVAAICHGPWTLVEAGVLDGKTLTSWPSLRTDIRNAGGHWVDVESFSCQAHGWTLVTSRKPDDLPAFIEATVAAVAGAAG